MRKMVRIKLIDVYKYHFYRYPFNGWRRLSSVARESLWSLVVKHIVRQFLNERLFFLRLSFLYVCTRIELLDSDRMERLALLANLS